jgi:alpha-glucosidase
MMADSPAQFIKEQETATFISQIPTVWDETKPIEGAVGDYIVMARRSHDEWFLGALTDEHKREFSVALDFLANGRYQVEIFQDGINANKWAEDYKIVSKVVTNSDSLSLNLAPGGGFAARFTLIKTK